MNKHLHYSARTLVDSLTHRIRLGLVSRQLVKISTVSREVARVSKKLNAIK